MDPQNENNNYDEAKVIRTLWQWVRKHRATPIVKELLYLRIVKTHIVKKYVFMDT